MSEDEKKNDGDLTPEEKLMADVTMKSMAAELEFYLNSEQGQRMIGAQAMWVKKIYDSYQQVGFTEAQALFICVEILKQSMSGQRNRDSDSLS